MANECLMRDGEESEPCTLPSDGAGERSRVAVLDALGRDGGSEPISSKGSSENESGGVSRSFVPSGSWARVGGSEGRLLSRCMLLLLLACFRCVVFFFRLLAIKPSWQSMQNMPCDVRAYRRFSIFFLQLRQRKHPAQ